jgi:ankyrin repeat protein
MDTPDKFFDFFTEFLTDQTSYIEKINTVKEILQNHPHYYKYVNSRGKTLLHIYMSLIDDDADIDAYDTELEDNLINNCPLDAADMFGSNALMLACMYELEDIAIKIINKGGFDINATDCDNETALCHACSHGLDIVISAILEKDFSNFNIVNRSGTNNALKYAIFNCDENTIIELLLAGDFDLTHVFSEYNETLLFSVCNDFELSKVANFMLDKGDCKEEHINIANMTVLQVACANKLEDIAIRLINNGKCPLDIADTFGNTALIYACEKALPKVAMLLLSKDCNMTQVNKLGFTAQYYAKQMGLNEVVEEIEKKKQHEASPSQELDDQIEI